MSNSVLFPDHLIADHLEESREWFAVYTSSCQEKRVAANCFSHYIESFLPTYRATRRWKNGCTMHLDRPLFPGYVFVKMNRAHRVRVLELPGVVSIVGAARRPSPLPETEIERLRHGISSVNAEPHSFLSVGESAKICSGPLAGMTGIVLRKKNSLRVVLSLDLIMKSIAVEVDHKDLQIVSKVPMLAEFSPESLAS